MGHDDVAAEQVSLVVLATEHPLEQMCVCATAQRWISEGAHLARSLRSLATVIATAATGAMIDGSLPSLT